ncbi:unnamed protein product [Pieris macdunnoughi]|uniref:Uncharacterized protein n=1 Tax=Pieris macdunnoughi TaxID=345717 RepID=A0A821L1I7_9NEOP|nr:unnamed protein product [Pieris macdunnoughi]
MYIYFFWFTIYGGLGPTCTSQVGVVPPLVADVLLLLLNEDLTTERQSNLAIFSKELLEQPRTAYALMQKNEHKPLQTFPMRCRREATPTP